MSEPTSRATTIGERVSALAAEHPHRPAVVHVAPDGTETALSWQDLDHRSDSAAHHLMDHGVTSASLVAISLPGGLDHVVTAMAVWKLGATVLPLPDESTDRETAALLETAQAGYVVTRRTRSALWPTATPESAGPVAVLSPSELRRPGTRTGPPPCTGTPLSAHTTGGSTGLPKVVVRDKAWTYRPEDLPSRGDLSLGLSLGQRHLVMLPLHHTGFTKLHHGLALDHTVILLERFIPHLVPRLIQKHRVNYFATVPSMMGWILKVPDLDSYDLTSVTAVHHGAAPCPERIKRAWLDLLGPRAVYEGYSSQERIGAVWIRGDEWLARPGSVGRAAPDEVRIVTADGRTAGPGEVGEVHFKMPVTRQPRYLGPSERLPERDGWLSMRDMGRLDEDGYLYLVGRRGDFINVGGFKVYPAEVEEALLQCPGVHDAAVVGREHPLLGQAVHALVVPSTPARPPDPLDLSIRCRRLLSAAKVPLTYEFVDSVCRNEAGKIRRGTLAERPDTDEGGRTPPGSEDLARRLDFRSSERP
ncbi:class I adenylate-forming enzyme family protein [Streptomyces sp. NPDC060053]|uniref:class I adenylate-forming enzyme family protein n=1 Tax=Streptomyces sp. NPDC060053 TaxID=3347047 RepID=UPI00368A826E